MTCDHQGPQLNDTSLLCQVNGTCKLNEHGFCPLGHEEKEAQVYCYPMPCAVVNRDGINAEVMRNQFAGASVFLIGGGPSLAKINLSRLNGRGIMTAAMNQCAATHVHPDFWFSVDLPERFHPAIWCDPGVVKFCRRNLSTHTIRRFKADSWKKTEERAREFPNTWFYDHRTGMQPDLFLTEPRPTWGTCPQTRGHESEARSVLLVSLRLLHWLGFSTIYLLGCDFSAKDGPYAFDINPKEYRTHGNQQMYTMVDHWLTALRPRFEAAGTRIFNCSPESKLTAFDQVPFDEALKAVTSVIPPVLSVKGLYS